MPKNKVEARYQRIAYTVAKRIVEGIVRVGDILKGRSLLASEFNVSSETVRKAMSLLSDLSVVEVKERIGVVVISREAAKAYVDQYRANSEQKKVLFETYKLLDDAKELVAKMDFHIKTLLQSYETEIFPFSYFRLELPIEATHLNETLQAIDFYQNTQTQIIAIEINGLLYQAPHPDLKLEAGMLLYVLGNKDVRKKVYGFFNIENQLENDIL